MVESTGEANLERIELDFGNGKPLKPIKFNNGKWACYKWKRWLIIISVFVLLVAGLILLIYFVILPKTGSEHRDTSSIKEGCPDVHVFLGEKITIICTLKNAVEHGSISVVSQRSLKTLNYDCHVAEGKIVTCVAESANCSTGGSVLVEFYNINNDEIILTRKVNVIIEAPPADPFAEISQEFISKNKSIFHLSCTYKMDCSSYTMGFYANNIKVTDSPTCLNSSSDSSGHSISCTADIPEEIIYKYGNGYDLVCAITDGSEVIRDRIFTLPSCSDFAKNNRDCSAATTTVYDCSNTTHILGNCSTKCRVIEACYPQRYSKQANNTCCHVKWCRDATTSRIDINEHSLFDPLCVI